jgi:stage II sporulation protein GA (sporulation sigma-E factor processing peptidase)
MEVYVDILLLENFVVNFFIMYIVMQTMRLSFKLKFIILSSGLGSLYVLTLLLPQLKVFTLLPFKLLTAFIMVILVIKPLNIWMLLRGTVLYIFYSMLLAGFIVFIELNNQTSYLEGMLYGKFSYKGSLIKGVLIAAMIIYIALDRLVVFIKDRRDMTNFTYTIEVGFCNCNSRINAFLDTGNELREPVTNLPVIIVERNILKELDLKEDNKMYIPYKVLNGIPAKIEAFKPTYIKLYQDENNYKYVNAVIGLCDGKLSELNDYNALLSRGIL